MSKWQEMREWFWAEHEVSLIDAASGRVSVVLAATRLRVGVVLERDEVYNDEDDTNWLVYTISLGFFPALAVQLQVNVSAPLPVSGGGND